MISTTVARTTYTGPNAGPFAFPFKIFAYADLLVTKRSAAGIETPLALTTDYTATGVNADAGGTISLSVALVAGDVLSIRRVRSLQQTTSLQNQGSYYAKTHEDTFDQLLGMIQDLQDQVARAPKLGETYDPAGYATKLPAGTAGQVLSTTGTAMTWATVGTAGGVTLPGQGRTTPTLSAYLQNNSVFQLLDYNAKLDGVTDDSAAVQAAIDACTAAGGGTVTGTGTSVIAGVIMKPNVTLFGNGLLTFKRAANTPNFTRLMYVGRGFASLVKNVTLQNLLFDGNIANQLNSGTDYAAGTDTIAFNGSYQQNHSLFLGLEAGYTGVGCDNVRLLNVRFNGSQGDGVAINQYATNIALDGVSGRACARGSFDLFGGGSSVKVVNGDFADWFHIENDNPTGTTSYCELSNFYAARLNVLGYSTGNNLVVHLANGRIDYGPQFEQCGGTVTNVTFNIPVSGDNSGTAHRIIKGEELIFTACRFLGNTGLVTGTLVSTEPENGATVAQTVTFDDCLFWAKGGTKAVMGIREDTTVHPLGSRTTVRGCTFRNVSIGVAPRKNGVWRVLRNTFDACSYGYRMFHLGGISVELLHASQNEYTQCDGQFLVSDNNAAIGANFELYDKHWNHTTIPYPGAASLFGVSLVTAVKDRREFWDSKLRFTPSLPPTAPSATPVVGGGTFAAGTYYWKVSALNVAETPASVEVSAVIALNGSATIAWTASAGATGYRIYRGTAAGGENTYFVVGNVTTFTDTGAAGTAGAPNTSTLDTVPAGWSGMKVNITDASVGGDRAFWQKTGTNYDSTQAGGRTYLSLALS